MKTREGDVKKLKVYQRNLHFSGPSLSTKIVGHCVQRIGMDHQRHPYSKNKLRERQGKYHGRRVKKGSQQGKSLPVKLEGETDQQGEQSKEKDA